MVKAAFSSNVSSIPLFFRRKVEVQTHSLDFFREALKSEILADPALRNGRTSLAELFRSSTADDRGTRAELTQPDHEPLDLESAVWSDVEQWKKLGHWEIKANNVRDKLLDPADDDPVHAMTSKVILSRTKLEACELETDITDVDVRQSPHFGSS